MAKDLKNILAGTKSSKEEKMDLSKWENSKGGQAFAAKHTITKHADRVGNEDHAYDSGKVKFEGNKRAKHKDQKDSVYESKMKCESCGNMYEGDSCDCGKMGKGSKKLILSGGKKKLDEVLDNHPEKKKVNEEPDFEYEMARNELETASRAIERLMKHLKGEGRLEAWVQSKITKGSDYLDTVADYMDSLKEEVSVSKKKKTKKKAEGESAPADTPMTYGASFSSNGPDGRI